MQIIEEMTIKALYDLEQTIAGELFSGLTYPWEALSKIGAFIVRLGESLPEERYEKRGENVWIAKSAKIYPSAYLGGPLIVDEEAEIRHCAFIRGSAIVGRGAVVGNSTELKNAVLFNGVQAPHYNYVGDSILGYKAHMGAGSITSNVKSDKTLVVVKTPQGGIETGLKKFGAMLGDHDRQRNEYLSALAGERVCPAEKYLQRKWKYCRKRSIMVLYQVGRGSRAGLAIEYTRTGIKS